MTEFPSPRVPYFVLSGQLVTNTSLSPGHYQDIAMGCRDECLWNSKYLREYDTLQWIEHGGDRRFYICFEAKQMFFKVCPQA